MEQVFRSILENALAACPDPVRAEVRCEAAAGAAGSRLRIAIRDNGSGLTAKQKRRIYEGFCAEIVIELPTEKE